jgi:hypothetical protein
MNLTSLLGHTSLPFPWTFARVSIVEGGMLKAFQADGLSRTKSYGT